MTDTRAAALRRLWLTVHLWIGLGLALLLIPISMSGALLVLRDPIEALINPQRYAVSGADLPLPPSAYLAMAAKAVAGDPADLRPSMLRYPEQGRPVQVTTRAQRRGDGPPKLVTVYLDPPTAKVLDVVDFRASLFSFLHVFHENLTLGQYNGRQIVGWVGVGMLTLSLTGLWLWWPRGGNVLRGLRWTRSPRFTMNLHHLIGFWISLPLAVISATGIYLGFPQTARTAMSSVAPMSAPARGIFAGETAQQSVLSADRAIEIARQAEPGATPSLLLLPQQQHGEHKLSWRLQMTRDSGETVTLTIDDQNGQAAPAVTMRSGDRAASWIRWIHEGSHTGPAWAGLVFLTGVCPTIFALTGLIMWLRKRADRRAL
jgi:uncharacterized iron-regulated membrane protein